jgi:transposase
MIYGGRTTERERALARVEIGIQRMIAEEPKVKLLMTTPNVSVIVAGSSTRPAAFAMRTRLAHISASSEKSSGDRRRLGAITKQGNGYARATLMQASWGLMRSAHQSDPLQQWAAAVARRRGKLVAAVALARRLAGIMWAMWRDDGTYQSAHVGTRSAAGLARQADDVSWRALATANAARKAQRRVRLTNASWQRTAPKHESLVFEHLACGQQEASSLVGGEHVTHVGRVISG